MNNEDLLVVSATLSILLVASVSLLYVGYNLQAQPEEQRPHTWFYLSAWNYPDSYSQGIEGFYVYENSTGSWLPIGGSYPATLYDYTHSGWFNWTEFAGAAIRLECVCWLNNTLVAADNVTHGRDYIRHNVSVYDVNTASEAFSQQNFTFVSESNYYDPMFLYNYYVVLDFIPQAGNQYVVTVTYEVFYRV